MNDDQPIDPTSDPDLIHLFDLLKMLPGPRENREFWATFERRHGSYDDKLEAIATAIHDPTPPKVSYACRYLMRFFSGHDPDLWKRLNIVTAFTFDLDGFDDTGRYWADDICRTAWTLYVRYNQYADERWKAKWEPGLS